MKRTKPPFWRPTWRARFNATLFNVSGATITCHGKGRNIPEIMLIALKKKRQFFSPPKATGRLGQLCFSVALCVYVFFSLSLSSVCKSLTVELDAAAQLRTHTLLLLLLLLPWPSVSPAMLPATEQEEERHSFEFSLIFFADLLE